MIVKLFFTVILTIFLISCSLNERSVNLYEKFSLQFGESVTVNSTKLKIKLVGTGAAENETGSLDYSCIVDAIFNENTQRKDLKVGESLKIENLNIKVENVVMRKSCALVVTVN